MTAELANFRPRRRIIPAAEAQAWIEGDSYRDIAKRDAEALLAEARAVFESERKRGIDAGLRAGAEAKAALLAEATARIDREMEAAGQQFAAAVIATVERVLGSFDRQELLVRAAKHALAEMREARHLILRVAAEEAAAIDTPPGGRAGRSDPATRWSRSKAIRRWSQARPCWKASWASSRSASTRSSLPCGAGSARPRWSSRPRNERRASAMRHWACSAGCSKSSRGRSAAG